MKTRRVAALAAVALTILACGDLARDNPADPAVSGGLSLQDQLLGRWSRDDAEKNEIYTFSADRRVELRDYTSPSGGTVDRNATFPTTRVRVYEGTFRLGGDLLSLSFTRAQSNDAADAVQVPATVRVVEISIRRNTLTFAESDGRRFYNRLQ